MYRRVPMALLHRWPYIRSRSRADQPWTGRTREQTTDDHRSRDTRPAHHLSIPVHIPMGQGHSKQTDLSPSRLKPKSGRLKEGTSPADRIMYRRQRRAAMWASGDGRIVGASPRRWPLLPTTFLPWPAVRPPQDCPRVSLHGALASSMCSLRCTGDLLIYN